MQLQKRFISYQNIALNIAAIVLDWEIYIDADDFPEYPDIRKKWLTLTVKQVQYLKDEYKGKYKTIFYSHSGRPWDHTTTDKMKKHVAEKLEEFILTQSNELLGKYNEPIIAQYKVGENNSQLDLFGFTRDTNRGLYV